MKKILLILFIITLTAVFLRFYKLGEIPDGFHRDEAFLGYNAYSLLKTGRDMNSNLLPVHLSSFLYSPAGYSYLSLPFIAIFGLNQFAVRFISAFLGSLTIPLLYILVIKLFANYRYKYSLSLFSSFSLAISPWHINLSRTATENVLALFFIMLSVIFYKIWIEKKKLIFLFFSFIFSFLTLFIYQAPRIFLPLFIPCLYLLIKSSVNKPQLRYLLIFYLVLIILPLVIIFQSSLLTLRIRTVSLLASPEARLVLEEQFREDGISQVSRLITKIYHNKYTVYGQQIIKNYFSHFSFDFLFTDSGLPDRYRINGVGLLYLFELPLFLLGLGYLLSNQGKTGLFILVWLALTPLGSALTFDDVPNLQRTLLAIPAYAIVIGFGFIVFFKITKKIALSQIKYLILIALACFVVIYNLGLYLHQYYVHLPVHKTWYRHEGYQDLVTKVNSYLTLNRKATITTRESAPAIFFLFFNKYDPETYQAETRASQLKDYDRVNFGNYIYSTEECPLRLTKNPDNPEQSPTLTGQAGFIYVNFATCQTPAGIRELDQIKRGDGSTVFRILTVE